MSWTEYTVPLRGLDSSNPLDMLADGFAPSALNVRFRYGAIEHRPGTFLISNVAEKPRWIGRFTNDTGTTFTLLLSETKLYRLVGTVWTALGGAAFTGTGRFGVAMGLGRIFFTRAGMGGVFYWDGNTVNPVVQLTDDTGGVLGDTGTGTAVNIPEAHFLEFFNDRLFLIRSNESKTVRIRWSVNGNSDNWNTAAGGGFLDLYDDLAEPLTGGRNLAGRMSVYKRRCIMDVVATGLAGASDPTHVSEVRVRGLGLAAPHTLVSTGQEHFFLSDDNVYAWDGSQLRAIGNSIQRRLKQLVDTAQLTTYFGAVSVARHEYYLVLGLGQVFIYDYARDSWVQDQYPTTTTVPLSALGEADYDTTVFNWAGAPAPITGVWSAHSEAWSEAGLAGVASLLGGGPGGSPLGTTFGTFAQDESIGTDYDNSLPAQQVSTRAIYATDKTQQISVKRALLRIQDIGDTSKVVQLAVEVFDNIAYATPTMGTRGFIFGDFNVTGQRAQLFWNTAGATFRWKSYMLDIEPGGQLLP